VDLADLSLKPSGGTLDGVRQTLSCDADRLEVGAIRRNRRGARCPKPSRVGAADTLLGLQRSVGNAAVVRLLTSESSPLAPGSAAGGVVQRAAHLGVGRGSRIQEVTFDKRPSGFRQAVYNRLGFAKGHTPAGKNICHIDPWDGFTMRVKFELVGFTCADARTFINSSDAYRKYGITCADARQETIETAIWQYCLDRYNDPDNVRLGDANTNKSMGAISRRAKDLLLSHLAGTITYPLTVRRPGGTWTRLRNYVDLQAWAVSVGIDSDDDTEIEELVETYEAAQCVLL
jgi:hypothetical protein